MELPAQGLAPAPANRRRNHWNFSDALPFPVVQGDGSGSPGSKTGSHRTAPHLRPLLERRTGVSESRGTAQGTGRGSGFGRSAASALEKSERSARESPE